MPNGEDKTILLLVGAGALALFAFWYMSNQDKGNGGTVPTTSTFSNMVVTFS